MSEALITGASSGLGRALARELASRYGVTVTLAARRRARLAELASEIIDAGGQARVLPLDVSDGAATAAAIRALDGRVGGLDLVIANAGAGPAADTAASYSFEALAEPLQVNLVGAAATLCAALPAMVARGRGHLVGICSLSSFGALPDAAPYCVPKAGLSMLLDCLRLDVAAHGVDVTTVNAGFIRTEMVAARAVRGDAMPQLLEVDDAARRIATALARRPAVIDLPQPLALGARALAALPRPLRDRLLRRGR
ncbi:MAG: SDR family NAD(P)-dependent oxidoreductase [Myxococcales bacterium]|nr:SDR family NAD(P)-dependent oxidoreductase [Myxococcales bacterium]